jgi:hypothetical protein
MLQTVLMDSIVFYISNCGINNRFFVTLYSMSLASGPKFRWYKVKSLKFASSMNETWQLSDKLCEGFHKNWKIRVLTRTVFLILCARLRLRPDVPGCIHGVTGC